MWPSLPLANKISDIANVFFIGSLVVGVVSTIIIVRMVGVKEKYWDEDRRVSAEKIATLATQGDQLRNDTAEANARAAEATKQAAEAQLALERFKAPRSFSAFDRPAAIEALSKFAGTKVAIYVVGEGPEPHDLAESIRDVLTQSGWDALSWNWIGIGAATGVVIMFKPGSGPEIQTPCETLVAALRAAHIDSGIMEWKGDWEHFGGMLNGPENPVAAPIRIVIGTKPQ